MTCTAPSADPSPWKAWTVEHREREYSPSSMLPALGVTLDDELRRYADGSSLVQLAHPPRTVAYGDHETDLIDVYVPPSGRARSTLVFIHGGYWQQLGRNDSAWFIEPLLESGWAVCVVDYELAPTRSVGEIVAQCVAACRFVVDNAAVLGIAKPIVVAGSSAGAHLAAHVYGQLREMDAAALLSGIFDLRPLVGTSINDALHLDDGSAAALSVSAGTLGRRRSVVIAVGEFDTAEFRRQSAELGAAASAAGHDVTGLVVEHRHHFDLPDDLGNAASALGAALTRLQGSSG
jgi:arylformamidase